MVWSKDNLSIEEWVRGLRKEELHAEAVRKSTSSLIGIMGQRSARKKWKQ